MVEWSSSSFDNYEMTTSEVYVSCSGNDGIANGSFRLSLNTSGSDSAVVQVTLEPLNDREEV